MIHNLKGAERALLSTRDTRLSVRRTAVPAAIVGVGVIATLIVLFTSVLWPERTVSVGVSDAIYEVHYRFSDAGAEMPDFRFNEETRSILMTVDVPRDTVLELRFHVELLDSVRGEAGPSGTNPGQGVIMMVDGEPNEVGWVRSEPQGQASTSIPLECGAKNISIVRASSGAHNSVE
jgi:hypothetical protein